jgi:putative ABC transport system permease protein
MDDSQASAFGLAGVANRVSALPAAAGPDAARRALFDVAGVSSVQEASAGPRVIRDRMNQFIGIFQVMEGALFVLAALIAFNTASINLDERSREYATMMAFGVPTRTILRIAVIEGALLGTLATVMGLVGGYLLARYFIDVLAARVLPDIGLHQVLTPASFAIVTVLGIIAVAITPLFGWRRLRTMNIPSSLRLME